MKNILKIFKRSFAIIGTIIGAGFISGREILSFFKGENVIFCIIFLAIFFTCVLYFILSAKNLKSLIIYRVFHPVILFGNLIIASGMISAIEEIFLINFSLYLKIPLFSILALLLSQFILSKGIDGLEKINAFLVPAILISALFILLFKNDFSYKNLNNFHIDKIISYVGINTFLATNFFNDLGEDLSKKECFFTALISSIFLCLIIFLILIKLGLNNDEIVNSPIPILVYVKNNPIVIKLFSIIVLFGVLTTLFSCHYPLFLFAENFQNRKIAKVAVLIAIFTISRLGFYNIINYVYPFLGYIGGVFLAISILLNFFQTKKQQDTLRQQEDTK